MVGLDDLPVEAGDRQQCAAVEEVDADDHPGILAGGPGLGGPADVALRSLGGDQTQLREGIEQGGDGGTGQTGSFHQRTDGGVRVCDEGLVDTGQAARPTVVNARGHQ